ncbi:hypothetical protein [Nonomuraea sp. NPDC050540]
MSVIAVRAADMASRGAGLIAQAASHVAGDEDPVPGGVVMAWSKREPN